MSDYELKRINALTEASAIGDDDVFALDSVNGTKKVKWSTIDGKVGDKVNGMLAVATVPSAEQLIAHTGITDTEPYFSRPSVSIGDREFDTLVGGSLGWNQLIENGNFASTSKWTAQGCSFTVSNNVADINFDGSGNGNQLVSNYGGVPSGHKYFSSIDVKVPNTTNVIAFNGGNNISYVTTEANTNWQTLSMVSGTASYSYIIIRNASGGAVDHVLAKNCVLIDLTTLFGSTIADYIYSLEQATAGAGVAWVRKYLPNTYYAYCAPTLKHVTGVSAHVMRDANDNIIGNYPLDSTWVGMGVPKLDNGKLYFDGDRYSADGTVTEKYVEIDLGSANWSAIDRNGHKYFYRILSDMKSGADVAGTMMARYTKASGEPANKCYSVGWAYLGGQALCIRDDAYNDAATFKTGVTGTDFVYEKATPTTSSATPFTSPQICDKDGTEEYVTTGLVPVGHETLYPIDIRGTIETISETPTTDGTYTLKCTVSGGVPTMEWVSE